MIIENNESRKLPFIITNMLSEIIYINFKAKQEFSSLREKDSIYEKISEDIFRKNTMYREKLDIVDTKDKIYFKAIMRVLCGSFSKTSEFLFLNNEYFKNDENIDKIKEMFSFYNSRLSVAKSGVDIGKLITDVCNKITSEKEYSYKSIRLLSENNSTASVKVDFLEMIVVATFFILNEIDFTSEIEIEESISFNNIKISISSRNNLVINPKYILENPAMNIRIEFLKYMCEKEGVEVKIDQHIGKTFVRFTIPQAKYTADALHANIFDNIQDQRVKKYISAFSLK